MTQSIIILWVRLTNASMITVTAGLPKGCTLTVAIALLDLVLALCIAALLFRLCKQTLQVH